MPKSCRTKMIAVIGNAEPVDNHSTEIDAADVVVRLNACSYFDGGKIGRRADILGIRSFGGVGQDFADGTTPLNDTVVNLCSEYWLIGEVGGWQKRIADRYGIPGVRQKRFNLEDMRTVDQVLNSFGDRPHQGASLGSMTVSFILADPRFVDARIRLYCFDFDGWQGHPWVLEKRFMLWLQYRGVLDTDVVVPLSENVPVLAPGYSFGKHDGEFQIMPVEEGAEDPIPINSTGAAIIKRIKDRLDFGALCEAVKTEFPGVPDGYERDVANFLWSLEDRKLVHWDY